MAKRANNLTPKQERFVAEYLVDLNATQAAIRAGYSDKAAKVTASRLLTNANVAEVIAERRGKLSNKLEITAERVLQEYARIGFADLRDFLTFNGKTVTFKASDQLTEDQARAVAEISETQHGVRIKLHDKKGALDAIAKHLGMFVERIEHAGPGGGPIRAEVDAGGKMGAIMQDPQLRQQAGDLATALAKKLNHGSD